MVAVRVDFNVPTDATGAIGDDSRIVGALPTVRHLQERGARVVLLSHFKRPQGKRDPSMSLEPVARALGERLGQAIEFAADCVGEAVDEGLRRVMPGGVILLENVRFHPGETANDPEFARELARPADLFVNDAFGVSHRAHASVVGITSYLPAYPGLLLEKELGALTRVLKDPKRPLVAIIGGAKISTKIGVLENLLAIVDTLILGGGMASTFLAAGGLKMGKSLVEEGHLDAARAIMARAAQRGVRLVLPADGVMAPKLAPGVASEVHPVADVPEGWLMLDIGPASVAAFGEFIRGAGTIVWNGPMGAYEVPPFGEGTRRLARMAAEAKAFSVIGGGDLVAAVKETGIEAMIDHVSTGGGATLEFLEGKTLPGIAALG